MPDDVLTRDRILEAAEDVLRRYGPAKATVIDVAKVLGVSHGSVYRHFPSKQALRDAVVERWLARISEPLDAVVIEESAASAKLRRWLDLLIAAKRSRASDDPQLFATYMALVADARQVVMQHVEHLTAQLAQIIADGVARGEFTVMDPSAAGRAVFNATARFHNPAHAAEWNDPEIDAIFEDVWGLVARGLGASQSGVTAKKGPRRKR